MLLMPISSHSCNVNIRINFCWREMTEISEIKEVFRNNMLKEKRPFK